MFRSNQSVTNQKGLLSIVMVFSLVFSLVLSLALPCETSYAKKPWGGDEMDDWPLTISCDPNYPIIGPEVGEIHEESITGLQKGNKIKSFTIKNYSPKIVKIVKKKKNTSYGAVFKVKGRKKGKAHIKITVKLKYAQHGKKKYVWNLKKYPVGYND